MCSFSTKNCINYSGKSLKTTTTTLTTIAMTMWWWNCSNKNHHQTDTHIIIIITYTKMCQVKTLALYSNL